MIAAAAAIEAATMRATEIEVLLPGPSSDRHSRRTLARSAGSRSSSRASGAAIVQASLSVLAGLSTRRIAS